MFSRLRRKTKRSLNLDIATLDRLMDLKLFGMPSSSGVHVNTETARGLTAVFCAERILSETLASVPLNLMQRTAGGKQVAEKHAVQKRLRRPNPWQTSFEWRRMLQGHVCIRGNAYAEIIWDANGYPAALIPRNPDKIIVEQQSDSTIAYGHRMPDGTIRPIAPGNMLHLRGISSDGIQGDSIISMFRNAIGSAAATEEHGARLFKNGAQVPFAIKHPKVLTEPILKNLRESFQEEHGGVENAHRPMFLEEGMDVVKLGLTMEDSQFIESRTFNISEFARIFNIPPHMLKELSRATFSNIEHLGIEFVTYTMVPWLVLWEQRMDIDLLAETDFDEYYTKFNTNGLLRGDMKSRFDAYAVARNGGWMCANDVRRLEDMNDIDNGDIYLQPLNYVPAGTPPQPAQPSSDTGVSSK
jgi:HK97 family phage portal protein